MGEIGGFLKFQRADAPERDPRERVGDHREFVRTLPLVELQRAGRALHGVRRPVLPPRLPAREPDPRLERPRLPRPLARGDRAAPPHEQLPGVHRPPLPRAVRGRVRARDQRGRRRHDQADRARDRRPRLGRGLDRPAAARGRDAGARVAVVGSGPAGLACAQQLDRARPQRSPCSSATRPAAGSCASASRTSRSRSASSSGASQQLADEGVEFRFGVDVGATSTRRSSAPATTRSCSPPARACRATCRSRAASSTACTSRWSTCTGATARRRDGGDRRSARRGST